MDIAKQRVINMAGYNVSDGHVIVCLCLSIKKSAMNKNFNEFWCVNANLNYRRT